MLSGMAGVMSPVASAATVNALAMSGTAAFSPAGAAPNRQLASLSDGHLCWLFSNGDNEPKNYDASTVVYTEGITCNGGVRRIQFTLELIYNGVTGDANEVVASRTVSTLSNPAQSLMAGLTTTGGSCPPGYYTGRITGTVDFRSGTPLTITRTFTSRQSSRSLSCLPPMG